MIQKSFEDDHNAKLYLIPTPIGNFDDMTIRAIEILDNVEVIFCEDTRISSLLLKKFSITNKLLSLNNYSEKNRVDIILDFLKMRKDIAIISDRGTPLISDPGYLSVKAAIEAGYDVVPLPGANAILPALIASGLEPYPFMFYGFLKGNNKKKKSKLLELKSYKYTMIFYESPHHLISFLKMLYEVFGNRKVVLARELTKIYEEFWRSDLKTVNEEINRDLIRGEYVIILEGNKEEVEYDLSVEEHVKMYIDEGLKEMDAIKKVAKDLNVAKSEIYKEYHTGKKE